MKSKTLVYTNGIVGIGGGIALLLGGWLVMGGAFSDSANALTSLAGGTTASIGSSTSGVTIFLNLIKIAILVLGILALIFYRGTNLVTTAPHVLFIVGGALSLAPFLGWVGGILAIIGGALYLANLKHFQTKN